ncbi:MAG: spermidine synthase [Neptuniibacter sp.]
MSLPGKEIFRSYDEFGPIRIFDDGNKRYLAFGDNDEQSCWLKSSPLLPQHDYSRAMLLALLFKKNPKRALTLGLGSGTLNSCLHHHYPDLHQQIIELRSEVIKASYKYFQLPRSNRLELHNDDAFEFLNQENEEKFDFIFSDLYGADGLDEQLLRPEFVPDCYRLLNPDGCLIINLWREHQTSDTLEYLMSEFPTVMGYTTDCGNWILIASKSSVTPSTKQLKEHAKKLSYVLGFSMLPFLNKLKVY